MRAAVDEAHKAGRPPTAHAIPPQAIVDAVEAGVQSIEHGTLLDEVAVEAMVRRGVALIPTLSVYDRMASHGPLGGPRHVRGGEGAPIGAGAVAPLRPCASRR